MAAAAMNVWLHGFWAAILQNSVYFLLVVNAAMFFIVATTLCLGRMAKCRFRRVAEAISTCVPVVGVIALAVLLSLIFGNNHSIYHWASPDAAHDPAIEHKAGFLNKGFFAVWTVITIAGWWLLGRKLRSLSRSIDDRPLSIEEGKKYIWNNTVWAAAYAILFCTDSAIIYSMALVNEH